MGRETGDRLAGRTVEQPRRRHLPYFAVAIVAAIAVWSMQQQSILDAGKIDRQPSEQKPTQTRAQPEESRGSRGAKGDLRTLFSADDYPIDAQRNGDEGIVQAELQVDEAGRVKRCSIVRSSGHASLDNATCRILQRRARFAPARDVNGEPVSDTVTTPPVVWRLEG